MVFLLECPHILIPSTMMDFMLLGCRWAVVLELPYILKLQFSGLLYSCDPMLCHVVLMIYFFFVDVFDG